MSANAYYYGIKELTVPDGTSAREIEKRIDDYIDSIEYHAERLTGALNSGKMPEFIETLEKVLEMLRAIYAKWLEIDVGVVLRSAKNNDWDGCSKKIGALVSNLLSLSIDIQTAQFESTNGPVNTISSAKMVASGNVVRDKTAEPKKVLSVDDRPEILTTVSAALSEHYKVLGAPSGHVALQITNQHKIDLFILDIDMPGMNGFELCQRIRALPDHKTTPIIFLTATSGRDRILQSMRLGVRDFIVKPAYNETLLAKTDKFLV